MEEILVGASTSFYIILLFSQESFLFFIDLNDQPFWILFLEKISDMKLISKNGKIPIKAAPGSKKIKKTSKIAAVLFKLSNRISPEINKLKGIIQPAPNLFYPLNFAVPTGWI